jgi:RNA polymerase sigma-70 factor, ECF subfamily
MTAAMPFPAPLAVFALPDRPRGGDDDDGLALAIAAGDAAALDQLYRRYRPIAFAAAYSLLQEPHAAEDVVHDAFLKVWRAAASFQPERGSLRAWLLTIVRNAAIDHLRTRRVVTRPDLTFERDDVQPGNDPDVASAVEAASDARRLHAALRTLPPAQRHAVELAFFAGLTHGEIAVQTGLPLGTVKGRVRLGLRRLRDHLQDLDHASSAPIASGRVASATIVGQARAAIQAWE